MAARLTPAVLYERVISPVDHSHDDPPKSYMEEIPHLVKGLCASLGGDASESEEWDECYVMLTAYAGAATSGPMVPDPAAQWVVGGTCLPAHRSGARGLGLLFNEARNQATGGPARLWPCGGLRHCIGEALLELNLAGHAPVSGLAGAVAVPVSVLFEGLPDCPERFVDRYTCLSAGLMAIHEWPSVVSRAMGLAEATGNLW